MLEATTQSSPAPAAAGESCPVRQRLARGLLVFILRFQGICDLTAIAVAFLPDVWIAWCHSALGLGTIPREPIVGYLARSASLMYALHGLTVLYVSFDLKRYWPLIRLLAIASLIHGGLMCLIDALGGMPVWWTWLEGPCFAATGAAILILQRIAVRDARS